MRVETIKALKDEDFKRPGGIVWEIFDKMPAVILIEMHEFGRSLKVEHHPMAVWIAHRGLYLPSGLSLAEAQLEQVREAVGKV